MDNLTQGGNGTAESPFATLAQAESSSSPGDMIYVYGGTSTTTGMDQGITLQDNQWLQGSGRSFLVLTDFGVDEIPAQTTNWPTIGNPTGNTITLANNNKIVGLNLISSGHNIYGLETQGASISYNNLAGSSMSDMYFENPSGIVNITHNNSRSASGLVLTTDENLTLNLQNNVLINNGQVNLDLTFLGNSTSNASLRFNTLEQSTDGSIIATENAANLTLNYQGNRMQHTETSSDSVITFSADDFSRMIVVAEDNYLAAPPLQGYEFITSGQALTFFYVEENSGTYTGSEDEAYPFTFTVNNSSISNLLLSGNTATSSGYLLTNNSSAATFNVQSPTLSLSGVQDLNTGTVSAAGSGTITFISYTPSSTPQLD